jgi:hypothetical protein
VKFKTKENGNVWKCNNGELESEKGRDVEKQKGGEHGQLKCGSVLKWKSWEVENLKDEKWEGVGNTGLEAWESQKGVGGEIGK